MKAGLSLTSASLNEGGRGSGAVLNASASRTAGSGPGGAQLGTRLGPPERCGANWSTTMNSGRRPGP